MTDFVAGTLAWMLVEIVLTGILLAAYFALRFCMPVAADRFRFLKLAFMVVVFLPWFPLPWGEFLLRNGGTNPKSMVTATLFKIGPTAGTHSTLLTWISIALVLAYFLACAIQVTRLIISLTNLHRIASRSEVAFSHEGVQVRVTDEDLPPGTTGLFRPLIFVSRRILSDLSASELKMVLRHEMYHIKRFDYLFNFLRTCVQAVLVFSPFIRKLSQAFVEDMELSCDAHVICRGGHIAKAYGSLLLRLATQTCPRTDLVYSGLFVSNSFISRRIDAMKDADVKSRRILSLAAFAVFAVVIGPTVASLGLDAAVERALLAKGSSGDNSSKNASAGMQRIGDMVMLNFSEPTHIKNLIKSMAQLSGKNIILSRDIDAIVQVVSQHPVSKAQALSAFVSALEQAGLTTIDEGNIIRIVRKPGRG